MKDSRTDGEKITWQYPWPGNGEPVGVQPHFFRQFHIFLQYVVTCCCYCVCAKWRVPWRAWPSRRRDGCGWLQFFTANTARNSWQSSLQISWDITSIEFSLCSLLRWVHESKDMELIQFSRGKRKWRTNVKRVEQNTVGHNRSSVTPLCSLILFFLSVDKFIAVSAPHALFCCTPPAQHELFQLGNFVEH